MLLILILILCLASISCGSNLGLNGHQAAGGSNGLQCQRISVSACQGLGYNMTALPNLAGHTNQLEAELQIAKLLPLIESGCSRRARFLLCSALFPLCTPDVPRPVTPCKSLCETVQSECSQNAPPELMELWPPFLGCAGLPQPEKHELCMRIPEEGEAPTTSPPSGPPEGHLAALSTADREISLPQQQLQAYRFWNSAGGGGGVAGAGGSAAGSGSGGGGATQGLASLTILCPQNFSGSHLDPDVCVPQCQRDAFHTTAQKKLSESLILGLSAVCFVLTLFALVTFWAEPTRFGYPERPVLFLCLCYNLFSVCYLERIVFHNQARSLAQLQEQGRPAGLRSACLLSPPCLASYITTSYLSLCAASWWLIFALCFYLSSHKKWSSEALEKRSGLFHVLAWVPPLAPPIAALLLDRVRPSELTGMCYAPGFVELPALVLLFLGLYFTLRASRSLHSLQQQLQPTLALAHHRFGQIRKRFVIFSLLYFVPTAAGVVAALCERYADSVVPSCSTPEDCASPMPLSAWPALLRIFFQLVGGTLTGLWVWSRKTCESYRNRLVAGGAGGGGVGGTHTSALMNPTKSGAVVGAGPLPKKHLYTSGKSMLPSGGITTPLYAGISFHNVPVYNPNQSRV
ncbi:frizzled-3 [Drosophila serrata]|uniref:frizzled-3 n=1 Tax=Drosophila serrata TaxID=7274 RepID=UPI000A1D0096|nr:frizzled-3 [Drosophila serrata]